MEQKFYDVMLDCPIIPAVKDNKGLEMCIQSEIKVVFVLFGDICSIGEIIAKLKDAGKTVLVHADLVLGLSPKEVAVDFIKQNTRADGIISTKINLIHRANELGLYTIYRVFILDSRAIEGLQRQEGTLQADFVEILPGVMPKVTKHICETIRIPVIAGGLIRDKEDVMQALEAGAMSISTTNQEVWFM